MPVHAGDNARYQATAADGYDDHVKILDRQFIAERRIARDHEFVVVGAGEIRVRHLFSKLRDAFISSDLRCIDQVDCRAIASNCVNLYFCRRFRHHDRAFLI